MRLPLLLLLSFAVLSAQTVTGERKQWHDVVLTFDGPHTSETAEPNPFLHYQLDVTFTQGDRKLVVPGYFAADGDAANTSATAGKKWRVHFVPDATGEWSYRVSFTAGGQPVAPHGVTGSLIIGPTDKTGRDHRRRGMLRYAGERYARYAGTGEYFIQVGTQSPENFLAYYGFDNTVDHGGDTVRMQDGLHHYEAHVKDWRPGDPTWKGGLGKGIIGALNYLASKGMNTYYSLTMNVGGDGREIYPWISYDSRDRYDVSKLDQWNIVLSHGDKLGMQLMLITQEEEGEQILGKMTPERKLYYRELIARFAHHHAILWDLSEEADRWRYFSTQDLKDMCEYIKSLDPYQHPIQYVQWKGELLADDKGYGRLLGYPKFDGTALQHDPENTHPETLKWVRKSAAAGHKWLVGVIEINPTATGVPPDDVDYWHDVLRTRSIWGNLMAGGSGSVYFHGVRYPNNDLDTEDFRPRDHLYDLMRYAHEFFTRHLPFHEMDPQDDLTTNTDDYVLAKPGHVYAIYLPRGGTAELDLTGITGWFDVSWYNPRYGGLLDAGTVREVQGGARRALGYPPIDRYQDWAILVRRAADVEQSMNVMLKLVTPLRTSAVKPGTPVKAIAFTPDRLVGSVVDGVVDKVSQGTLAISFHALRHRSRVTATASVINSFVNSKGHRDKDDAGRDTVLKDGVFTSAGEIFLDEGAELRVTLNPRAN